MAWLDIFTGVDTEEEAARQADIERRDRELQQRRLEAGKITTSQYEAAVTRIEGGHIDIEGEVNQAFNEGLEEGYNNTTGFIKSAVAAPFNFVWASLPWQLILLALVAAFFYFGGGTILRRWMTTR